MITIIRVHISFYYYMHNMPRGIPNKPKAKKVATVQVVQAEVEELTLVEELPLFEQLLLSVEIEQRITTASWTISYSKWIDCGPRNIAPQVTVLLSEGYIGPLVLNRNFDGMLLCQFPLCNEFVFIYDPDLGLNLCDGHSLVTKSQIKIASTPNVNSSNYKTSARTIKHFFTRHTSTAEILTKTTEISNDMELPCNRKRASNKASDAMTNISKLLLFNFIC